MASIAKRENSNGSVSWKAQVRIEGYPARTASHKTERAARRWAATIEAAMHEGRHFRGSAARLHTLADAGIAVCHLRFRKAWVAQGRRLEDLKFRAKFFPYGPWLALALFVVVLFGANIGVFQTAVFSWFDCITGYLMIPAFIAFCLCHKYWNKRIVRLQDCNFEMD